jgi:hypothetical protein
MRASYRRLSASSPPKSDALGQSLQGHAVVDSAAKAASIAIRRTDRISSRDLKMGTTDVWPAKVYRSIVSRNMHGHDDSSRSAMSVVLMRCSGSARPSAKRTPSEFRS